MLRLLSRAASVIAIGLIAASPGPAEEPKAKGKANRLAKESSPYLLQHAYNPVDWYAWRSEAFERAKKENKLIFLSIGYSSCHWCHVMERESFANAEIAKLLNDKFVCIKVDREERPDIDDIYMTALSVTGQQGGWPLTMILTPEGKPIFGGTYFPPIDKKVGEDTIPGMKTILARVIELDKKERDELVKQADHIAKLTVDALDRDARMLALVTLNRDLVDGAADAFEIDPEHGGTGSKARKFKGTKFPRPAVWLFLLSQSEREGKEETAKLVHLTLRKMAEGGIYDHLGGGFHRYSTERTWTVPHFEKMLYDNAQLVELYSGAFAVKPDPLYRRVVEETLAFVKREMTSPEGAFYSALDADTNHEEGEFYVWKPEELRKILGDEAPFFAGVYGDAVNFEGKAIILRLPRSLAEIAAERKIAEKELLAKLEPLKRKLLDARAKRDRPFLDTKVITAWNGQMIAGYARAGKVFRNADFIKSAAAAADFILTKMRGKDGRLARLYAAVPGEKPEARGTAFLDDYTYFIHGLLSLHDATGEKKWLAAAMELTDVVIKWHGDGDRGAYFFAPSDGEKLFARAKDGYDGVQPSGNSQMARNLLLLAQATGEDKYRAELGRVLKRFALTLRTNPGSMPTMALCLHEYVSAGMGADGARDRAPAPRNPKESADVVKGEIAVTGEDGKRKVVVTLLVADGWHIYANPVESESLAESQTVATLLVDGKAVKADLAYPKGRQYTDAAGEKYNVYLGTVRITGITRAPVDSKLEARIQVTACKDGKCLLPSTIRIGPPRGPLP
jgi:uncharacterized protein YyaL (SSP411 family)